MSTNDVQRTRNAEARDASDRFFGLRIETLVSFAFFLALWFFWGVRYADFLFAAQENSIFLFHWDFLTRWLETPEGALCYVTAFFLQFAYYPALGGLILALFGVGVQVTFARLCRFRGAFYVLSLLPTCLTAISATWTSYFIYIPFNLPLTFSEPLALLFALGVLASYRAIKRPVARLVFAFVVCAVGYLGVGFWAPFSVLLCAVDEGTRIDGDRRSLMRAVGLILGAVLIPIALRYFWLYPRLKSSLVFTQGLIEDVRYDKDSLTAKFVYGCAAAAPLFLLLSFLIKGLRARFGKRSDSKSEARRRERIERKRQKTARTIQAKFAKEDDETKGRLVARAEKNARARLVAELVFVVLALLFIGSYHTRVFFDILKINRALVEADWDRILEIDAKNPVPSSVAAGFRNLALYRKGLLLENAFDRPIAGEATLTLNVVENAKALAGNPYYKVKAALFNWKLQTEASLYRALMELCLLHWGCVNHAASIATNNLVATEDRSISFCKTLALAALVNGERDLARRYLYEVSQTLFYKDWANACMAFADSREFYDGVRDFNHDSEYGAQEQKRREEERASLLSVEEAAERYGVSVEDVQKIARQAFDARALRPKHNFESSKAYPNATYLLEIVFFDEKEYEASTHEEKGLILLAALLQKEADFFLKHIEEYIAEGDGRLPKALEQGYATWRFAEYRLDWDKCDYKFSDETRFNFAAYVAFALSIKDPSDVLVQKTMRDYFVGTYWGYASDNSVFNQY